MSSCNYTGLFIVSVPSAHWRDVIGFISSYFQTSILADLLKDNSFAQAEFSDWTFCAEQWALNAIKTCETLRNFVKLCQNHKKCLFFFFLFCVQKYKFCADAQIFCTSATFRSSAYWHRCAYLITRDLWSMKERAKKYKLPTDLFIQLNCLLGIRSKAMGCSTNTVLLKLLSN